MAPRSTTGKSRAERAAYTQRRAERTAKAPMKGSRWSIDDARTALDTSLSVPEVALMLGRTAAAVEGLRARWRAGELSSALADQLPPAPSPVLRK
ncbi:MULTISPECIES: hypothetical protein [Mycolicibacter]|uniref:Uncharacterized protein n=1 Tax=Mycolicibacter longobardus TaxID=1108812 RepID=A0A1X1YAI8_9MYCO|nr:MULTISPECIES: hypothetical protein [Mycolicibacter]ORW08041.1 hypothetical protein AWC16_20095 [Mycolicibacter longobardus]RAV04309.1 hypothetical protein DQP56_00375 [Mycolicibacter senuensis]